MHVHSFLVEIDEPDLGDPGAGIKAKLDSSIVGGRGVHHLDHCQDLLRLWAARHVEIRPGFQQDEVWLRLRSAAETDRPLYAHDGAPAYALNEEVIQSVDATEMAVSDRPHRDDLPLDQLDPI